MEYNVCISGKLPSLNEYIDICRRNKYGAANFKKEIEDNIIWKLKSQMHGVIITEPVKIEFTWHEANSKRDLDNISSAKKFILDAFVRAGFLENDTRKCVAGFVDNFPEPNKEYKVEVKLITL